MERVLPLLKKNLVNNDVFRFFCSHKAALTVFNYFGITDGIFYLNNSLDLRCEQSKNSMRPFVVSIDYMPILSTLRNQTDFIYGDDYYKIWADNKARIVHDCPVIIGVDQYYLPYHTEFRRSHGAHSAVLYGFNDEKKQVFLLDEGAFFGCIDFRHIHQARISENSWNFSINTGAAVKYASLTLNKTGWPAISQTLICRHLQESIAYFEPHEKQDLAGYAGLKQIMHLFLGDADILYKESDYFRYIHSQLLPQAQKKRLFLFFLLHIRKLNGVAKLIDQMDNINRIWNELLLIILKLAYTSRNKYTLIHEIQEIAEQILQKEAQIQSTLKYVYNRFCESV